jgi:hypothetical protein
MEAEREALVAQLRGILNTDDSHLCAALLEACSWDLNVCEPQTGGEEWRGRG